MAAAAVGSRDALALALFAPRSISADVFEVVPGSYLGCPVELAHDLGCFEHAKLDIFCMVYFVLRVAIAQKSTSDPSTPLPIYA